MKRKHENTVKIQKKQKIELTQSEERFEKVIKSAHENLEAQLPILPNPMTSTDVRPFQKYLQTKFLSLLEGDSPNYSVRKKKKFFFDKPLFDTTSFK